MNRFSAFAIHLSISFLIFLVLAYLVVYQWYPDIFFDTDGGWRGMRIIIAVDLVLGPTLTFVVYKKGKPGLRSDLTFIGMFQLACLIAGTYVVFSERPLAVVYTDGRFTVMSRDDYVADAQIEVPDLRHFPGDSPKWVMVELPEDTELEHTVRAEAYQSGRLLNSLTERYVPFAIDDSQAFLAQAEDFAAIAEPPGWAQRIDAWLTEHGLTADDVAFFTFSTRYAFGYLIYDRKNLEQIGLLTNLQ